MRIDGALEKAGFEVLTDTTEGTATMFEGKVWWNSDHNVYKIYLNGAIRTCVDNRLIGSAANEIDMGDFTGSTITSDQSIKECLQDLETQVETNTTSIAAQPSNVGIAGNASGDDTRTGTSYETLLSCSVTTGASGVILLTSYGVMRVEGSSGYTGTIRIKVGSDTSANVAPRGGVGSTAATAKTLNQADSPASFGLGGIWTGLAAYTTYTCYLEMKHDNSAVDLWGIQSGGVLEAFGS